MERERRKPAPGVGWRSMQKWRGRRGTPHVNAEGTGEEWCSIRLQRSMACHDSCNTHVRICLRVIRHPRSQPSVRYHTASWAPLPYLGQLAAPARRSVCSRHLRHPHRHQRGNLGLLPRRGDHARSPRLHSGGRATQALVALARSRGRISHLDRTQRR